MKLFKRTDSARTEAISPEPVAEHDEATARRAYVTEIIRKSGLVDANWYRSRYPDVAESGADPVQHYLDHGAKEGRNPGPHFNTIWYVSENPEFFVEDQNPLLHYIEHGAGMGLSPVSLSDAQAFESFLRTVRAGRLSGTQFHNHFDDLRVEMRPPSAIPDHELPLPPVELSERIGSPNLADFERIGRETKDAIVRCLPAGFTFEKARCLDFGCGVGRIIRHFSSEAEKAEFWGCDIDGTSISWNIENLGSLFRFFQLGDTPSIPLEDDSFDLVYAVGVFSQLFVDWHAWAMEIRRVLKPGGIFFMTFAGQIPFEEMLARSYADEMANSGVYVRNPFAVWNKGGPTVFLSDRWIEVFWGNMFDIDFISLNGLLDYHCICLMRKPASGRPGKMKARSIEVGTSYKFDPDATGRIYPKFDPALPYLQSFGIQGRGDIGVKGWIVFRGDHPVKVSALIDGEDVGVSYRFLEGGRYRDWDSIQWEFEATLDAAKHSCGQHRLKLILQSQKGHTHELAIPLTIL